MEDQNIENLENVFNLTPLFLKKTRKLMTSSYKQIEIHFEDTNPQKWHHLLKEETFAAFMSNENSTVHKIFGSGSLFSPLLFGKFFDPSDAFPLWEFESRVLLQNPNNSSFQTSVDWLQTDSEYVLKAELPAGNDTLQICVVTNGEILEISGLWRQHSKTKEQHWKNTRWWEYGYVRRIELPNQLDWIKTEAHVKNDKLLEIKIPKIPLECVAPKQMNREM